MASAFKFLTARTKQLELELTLWGVGWQRFLEGWTKEGERRKAQGGSFLPFCFIDFFAVCVCSFYAVGALN